MTPAALTQIGFGFGPLAIATLGFVVPSLPDIPMSGDMGGYGQAIFRQPERRRDDDELLLMVLL